MAERTDVNNFTVDEMIEHGVCSKWSIEGTIETNGSLSNPKAHYAADANVPVRGDGLTCAPSVSTDSTDDDESTVTTGYETGYAAYVDAKYVTKNVHSLLVMCNVVGVVEGSMSVKSSDL